MKFTTTIDINVPMEKAVALFNDPETLRYCQEGYAGKEPISGKPGEKGAKAKILFNVRGRSMELIETILVADLPREMTALYEHEHMVNTMTNRFSAIDRDKTKYEVDVHYTKFVGFIPKMMALLMPGFFRKQGQKTLDRFKVYAEGGQIGNG